MSDQVFKSLPATTAAPADFVVPNAVEWLLRVVSATFDGTSAATAYLPAVQIIGPGGVVAATFADPAVSVAAGGSAEVTFGPFLRHKTAGGVTGFLNNLLITVPDALWKMDETAGTTAFDYLAGHHDDGVSGNAPTFNATTSPVSSHAPHFGNTSGFTSNFSLYSPNLSGDFSAALWWNRGTTAFDRLMGQLVHGGNIRAWGIEVAGPADINPGHIYVDIGDDTSFHQIYSDVAITNNTWYFVCVTHAGALWTLYINGVAQAQTYSGAYFAQANPIWIVYDGTGFPATNDSWASYAALWATRALSASEIAGLYLSV